MKKTALIGFVIWVTLMFTAALVPMAHCAIDRKGSSNSFGALIYQDNPNQYLMGSIAEGTVTEYEKRIFTVIRFRPTNTYGLFTQDIPFCGNEASSFEGMSGVLVITFSKVMHNKYCYELYRVDKVMPKELPKE